MWSTSKKTTLSLERADHQAKPSRNSWDRPSASEVKASTYLIRFDQAAGAAKLRNEVAKRLKERNGVPWWSREPVSQRLRSSWRRNGKRQSSDGLVEGWIVKGLVVNEGPQDMQELVHEDTQGLHFGEWVIGPPLQMRIELSEVVILLVRRRQVK
jgi:hypothetical protein